MSESSIAIIPARGGSKRIPRKNIRPFLGLPIISYSIKTALQSGLFTEVMVSTDDEEIAEIAMKAGAEVPFLRSVKNADDFAPTVAVIHEVLEMYREKCGLNFGRACCIYPTAPLIREEHLRQGLEKLKEGFDTVFPIVAFGYPIWRGVEISGDGKTQMIWPEFQTARSQDLKQVFHDAGQWYWCDAAKLRNALFTDNSASIILNEDEVQDIDTLTDWKLAEMKFKLSRAL
jgi:N-acylneuraminate cytidylyltransferase